MIDAAFHKLSAHGRRWKNACDADYTTLQYRNSTLVYFINPIDAIPDVTPIAGFTDDLGVIIGALAMIAVHITPEIKKQATQKAAEWFD